MSETKTPFGATPDDWNYFDLILGLGADLLPVVARPGVKISVKSKINDLGKVPSLYNKDGEVVGIANWTNKNSRDADIDHWSSVEDYGICLQTRRVRALDVDVEDKALAGKIAVFINKHLGFDLPCRYRTNSSKFLLAFDMPGDFQKRILPVEGGMIEFLATGQQFVAAGTHPSGVRYRWSSDDAIFPRMPPDVFESLWAAMIAKFATGEVSASAKRKPRMIGGDYLDDQTVGDLDALGLILSRGRDGAAYIECPFKAEHTGGASGTATAYFPPGRGYEVGHFKCLHAHCAGRSDSEFAVALGLSEPGGGFDAIASNPGKVSITKIENTQPKGLSRNKLGAVMASLPNLEIALTSPHWLGEYIKYDEFRDEIMFTPVAEPAGWRPFSDTDYTRLRITLENKGFLAVGREMIRDCVQRVAKLHRFDSAIEWLSGLKWDGVPRVSRFMADYMGAQASPYSAAVSDYTWAALAGRVMSPGCKADAAPIFVGAPYIGKSHAIANMVPDQQFFVEINFSENEDNLARKMRGRLIAEFAELKGIHSREVEVIKAFISRQHENWVPKYQEFATTFPRRLLFIGTTNKDEFFSDETGNRKWFPVEVTKADIKSINKFRNQLWAEGREMFLKKGVESYYHTANCLAEGVREDYMFADIWEDTIDQWLYAENFDGEMPYKRESLRTGEVLKEALGIDVRHCKLTEQLRIGKILRKFGYEKHVKRIHGKSAKVWIKCEKTYDTVSN